MALPTDKLIQIKAMAFDFDGVMTNGDVWTFADKETVRAGNIKDGYAIQYAVKKGLVIAISSGATSMSINNRMESLGVKQIYTGCANKMDTFRQFLAINNLSHEQVLYMGDDIPDYEVMLHSGIATCPADAAAEIQSIAHYVSPYNGGRGAVRDVIEQVLKAQNLWFHPDAVHW